MSSIIAIEIEVFEREGASEAHAQILLSREGAEELHSELGRLLSGQSDHFHLFHPDWGGGGDLTVILTKPASIPVKQIDVRMYEQSDLANLARSTKSHPAKHSG